jgi:uncharacterized caspase-like protein
VDQAVRNARLVHSIVFALAVWLGGIVAAGPASAESRVALVIGNSAYAHGGRLTNPANDATQVAQSLRKVGFNVVLQTDLGKNDLEAALKSFTRASAGADIALVYYAGHGIEHGGTNYLIPIDATLASDADIDFEAVPLDLVMHSVVGATKLKIVILDACRNNPFRDAMRRTAGTRGIGQGLAKPPDPEEGDMLVAYAAEAGSTAEDGTGANSPFATALARHLPDPDVDIRIMFGRIRDDVRTATGMRQEPAVYESLGGEQFDMATATPEAPAAKTAGAKTRGTVVAQNAAPPDPKMMDLTYWQSVQGSNDPAQLKSYLEQYPNGAFAALAKDKIAALQAPATSTQPRRMARSQPIGVQTADATAVPTAQAGTGQAPAGQGALREGPPRGGRAGRFDGPWRVSQTCPNPQDPAHPFAPLGFTVHVHGGRVHGSRGVADQPGWLALDGIIEADGAATLAARGVTGRAALNGMPAGSPFSNVMTAHFTETGGEGHWAAKRACQFSFARPSGADAQASTAPDEPRR